MPTEERSPTTTEPRKIYVLVEPSDEPPTIRSCDSFLTTLCGLEGLLEQ